MINTIDMTDTHHVFKSWCLRLGGWLRPHRLGWALSVLLSCVWLTAGAAPVTTGEITRPLTLDRAIQLALERNPDVKSAENALQAAEAARRAAVGRLYPQIQALSWYDLFPTQDELLLPGNMKIPTLSEVAAPTVQESMGKMLDFQRNEFQDSVFNIGMGLSWPLYAGGRLAAGVRAARADSRAAAYRLSGIRQKLAFAVTQTYLGIGVAKRSEQAVQASVRHLSAAETNLQEFVRVGKRPRLDLLRVQARLEQTRQLLADTQAALVTVRGNLRRLLDLDPSGPPLALAAPNGTPDVTLALQPLAAAIHTALLNRPDYRALLSGVEARRAQVSIA
ncbi:Outer membrane efflux protein, partial [mine drainage metagenome]